MTSKAQVAINILVRNLFERTADIGFLSTDDDIRAFAKNSGDSDARAALQRRFEEYVRKYSVYSDIILLNPEGHVLARLDENVPVDRSADPIDSRGDDDQGRLHREIWRKRSDPRPEAIIALRISRHGRQRRSPWRPLPLLPTRKRGRIDILQSGCRGRLVRDHNS